jgi:hypothetical protein
MDVAQTLVTWVPGPLLALVVLGLVKREFARLETFQSEVETFQGEVRAGIQILKDKMLEMSLAQRDFITAKAHAESTNRVYEEMRKLNEATRERLLKLELIIQKKVRLVEEES